MGRQLAHWFAVAFAVAVAVSALGCGSNGDLKVESSGPVASLKESDVMSAAPLPQPPGSPFVADARALWYSDFKSLARFDMQSRTWSTLALPFESGRVDGLAIQPSGSGGLTGVAVVCSTTCERGAHRTLKLLTADDGKVSSAQMDGPADVSTDAFVVPAGEREGVTYYRVPDGSQTVVVSSSNGSAHSDVVPEALSSLCVSAKGFLGVRDDAAAGKETAPKSIIGGTEVGKLAVIEAPSQVTDLLNNPGSTVVCSPVGDLSIVASDASMDVSGDGSTALVASDVGLDLAHQLVTGTAGVNGEQWVAATVQNLYRDVSGWHAVKDDSGHQVTGYAVVDGTRFSYPWSAAASPTDAIGPQPTVTTVKKVDK